MKREERSHIGVATLWRVYRDNLDFQKLYVARLISQFGDWFNLMAIVHLLGKDNGPPLALAFVFILKIFPYFLLGPIAGVAADRFDRKKIQIACNLAAACVVLLLLLTGESGSHFFIFAITFAQVSISAFYEPARQAILPDTVPEEDLVSANALYSVTWSIMFALGSVAGGIAVSFLGWKLAVIIDSATYVISALILSRMTWTPAVQRVRKKIGKLAGLLDFTDFKEGVRYIHGNKEVRQVILAKFGWGSMGAISLFLTLLGRDETYRIQGHETLGITYLWFCRALGTAVGPLLATAYAGNDIAKLRRTISAGFFTAIPLYVALSFVDVWWLGGICVLIAHFGGSAIWVMCTLLLMKIVPDEYRGRTFAAEFGLVMLSSTLSLLCYGLLLQHTGLGLSNVLRIACAVCCIPAILFALSNRRQRSAEDLSGVKESG